MRARVIIIIACLLFAAAFGSSRPAQAQALPRKISLSVTADKLDYDRTSDVYLAVGHVKIEQEGVRLEADRVSLDNKTGVADAEGHVYLQDKGDVLHAEKMKVNLNTREGVILKGDIFITKDNYHLKGDVIERRSETVYRVEGGEFTTCDESDWFIRAAEMNIDMDRYATGSDVSFNMAGVPVFYTPYLLFPVRRQTGFLIPVPGYSTKDGIFVDNAFFWAISDYTDMTVYSDYRARTGHGTGLEYRYENSRESSGRTYYKFWDLYHSGTSRWDFRFQHQEEFAEDLSARADINLVSDERYFSDLDQKLENRSRPYLDSNAFYVERWNTAALYLMGQYSIDLTRTNEKTVQVLPHLRYTLFDETIAGPLHLGFEGSATNFSRQEGEDTRRVDFSPRLTAALGGHGLSFTPRAGVRATFYDRSADSAEPTERKFFFAGADVNARVSRIYGNDAESGLGRIRHSIEPTLSYTYIPHVDQGNIPRFDSVDSVSAQNASSISLINRLTAHYKESKDAPFTTFDLMVLKVSQSYDLNAARDDAPGVNRSRSEILGELYLKTPSLLTLTATGTYNTYDHEMSTRSAGAWVTTRRVSVNLTEQFARGDPGTRFLIGGIGLNLDRWKLAAQWWRDVVNEETTQEDYSLNYLSQCWGIRTTYTHTPGDYRFMAMLDLKGLGNRSFGQ